MLLLKKILLLIGMSYVITGVGVASDTIVLTADKQYDYAYETYEKGDYLVAVVEFKRFIAFFPEDPRECDAVYYIGMAWYKSRNYSESIRCFKEVAEGGDRSTSIDSHCRTQAVFMLANTHVASGNPVMAEISLSNFIQTNPIDDLKDKARNQIGWIRLETAKWEKATDIFSEISETNADRYRVAEVLSSLGATSAISEKSPALGGTLAVLPGAGYLYTGRYQDAWVSFLLNSALMYGAYEAFDHDLNAIGGVITFIGFGFYSGTIYGSVTSVHKYNRNARRKFIRKLKTRVPSGLQLGLYPDIKRKGILLGLHCPF